MITTLIIRGQQRLLSLSGLEPSVLILPISVNMLQWLFQSFWLFQVAMEGFHGAISVSLPGHRLLTVQRVSDTCIVKGSPQIVELAAVVWLFHKWTDLLILLQILHMSLE